MSIESYDPNQPNIQVTDKALKHFTKSLAQRPDHLIRLSIKKSGCTGYAYVLDYVEQAQELDKILSLSPAVRLAVSEKATQIAKGTEIDYVLEGVNRVIKFNNPNVIAECGCGESFTV